jgi:lipopolysaccharide biosynthesis glycosyltransferase
LKKVRGNWNTYLRVFIPFLLPEFDRILYIDSDTLIVGDISDFYNIDFGHNYFAACIDYAAKSRYANIESRDILDKGEYHNCGVLLLNNARLVEVNLTDQILSFLGKTQLKFRVADQSIINYLYHNKFKTVDIGYNFYSSLHYFNSYASRLLLGVDFTGYHKSDDEIKIIHFIGHWFERPWFKSHYSIFSKAYLKVFTSCGFTSDDLLETPNYSKHHIYDYAMLFLRKRGFLTVEFYFRYLVMQKLKSVIKVER